MHACYGTARQTEKEMNRNCGEWSLGSLAIREHEHWLNTPNNNAQFVMYSHCWAIVIHYILLFFFLCSASYLIVVDYN